MAAILQRQPLTIKQQVEKLKNWHKQQQSKLQSQTVGVSSNKSNQNKKVEDVSKLPSDSNSNPKINFDEIPIKVVSSNYNAVVENNVAPTDSYIDLETGRSEGKGIKPKFRFLKKGEGIARFKMGPPKVSKKTIPRRHNIGLRLTRDSTKPDDPPGNQEIARKSDNVITEHDREMEKLKIPDLKLNFTWKSILSAGNPEDMLEKAISSNQIDLMDPNSSMDSSTASLMEKLLALGKNKLLKDREELRIFEAIEQHMLDSSFCSTSSYVNKLMENAVMSTPNKKTVQRPETINSKNIDQLPDKVIQKNDEGSIHEKDVFCTLSNPTTLAPVMNNYENTSKISNTENNWENPNNTEPKTSHPVAIWTKPGVDRTEEHETTVETSIESLEQSLHVRFAEHIDYKSFVEQSQSVCSISQREENISAEFDESQEWKEDSDSSSCCSQCSHHESLAKDVRALPPQENQLQNNQSCSQNEQRIPIERLHVGDLKINDKCENNDPTSNGGSNNFPPLLIEKLKELEEEIKVFREQNQSIKTLRESLERERKVIQEEKRLLNLEKKKFQKEFEEERKRLTAQVEEEKQKLAKEKIIFEKYSKSLTKNPSREERKEIQALREQLSEMKEELNKKESRWGAAQARVRNQVKILEQDNKKLREEIENFRKQAKYWDLFNQKKKGKPFNNTRLIHAISEHISNIVLDEEGGQGTSSANDGYFSQNLSAAKTCTITQSDPKSMYGVKVTKEINKNSLPSDKNTLKPTANSNSEEVISKDTATDVNINGVNNSPYELNSPKISTNFPVSHSERITQNEDRCQKPSHEGDPNNIIKEVVDESGNVEIVFPNGNIKKINKITGSEKYIYINGDVEEITHDGTVKYYYSKSRIWQTTLPDGLEIVDFPDGKVEKRHVDGTIEIIYSNNNKKISYPDNSQEIIYADGTKLKIKADKTHILTLPNGQKEIHTEEWKRREYPDGTMKTLYPDGTTETVYANGRVRLKDKYGNLVMDSGSPQIS